MPTGSVGVELYICFRSRRCVTENGASVWHSVVIFLFFYFYACETLRGGVGVGWGYTRNGLYVFILCLEEIFGNGQPFVT